MALGNILPNHCAEVWQKYVEGRYEEAEVCQRKLTPVNDVASNKFGSGGLKFACEVMGYPFLPSHSPFSSFFPFSCSFIPSPLLPFFLHNSTIMYFRYFGGHPRAPLPRITKDNKEEIINVLKSFGSTQV